MNTFDSGALIADLAAAKTAGERFHALTQGLCGIGLDIVNYGFFDADAAKVMHTDVQFLTTMRADWMDYYYDKQLARSDSHVLRVVKGGITPYFWGETDMRRIEAHDEREVALQGAEAGLRAGICIPLAGPLNPFTPVAGVMLGSSLDETEFRKITAEHGATLLSIGYLFHNASIRQLWRDRAQRKPLTTRERDCLQYLADGKRQDAIAQAVGVARVTVEMHLRSAREKLGAQTLHEAIAKGLVFGEIERG